MTRAAAIVLVLTATLSAAPKLKPRNDDVKAGVEFLVPWPPVEIPPPRYFCRIAAVTENGVDVRVLNVSIGECRLFVDGTGRAYHVGLDSDSPLPTAAQVQRLIEQSKGER